MMATERFAAISAEEAEKEALERQGIGTYGEKRLHRTLKRYVCDREECYEIPVGRYVADVLDGRELYEIQTGSFHTMPPKLSYYLEHTDYTVHLIHPLLETKTVIRMDRETGEVLRRRKTHIGGRAIDALPELYPIGEFLKSSRVTVTLLRICADEYRYSERMRYRKEGAYDSELFPRTLVEEITLCGAQDYRCFLPPQSDFTAAEYGNFFKLKRRDLYSALNLFCKLGLLSRQSEGRAYRYFVQ